jgi:hypothetical protein
LQSIVGDNAAAQTIGPQNALLAQQKAAKATGIRLDENGVMTPQAVEDAKTPHAAVYDKMEQLPGEDTPSSYTQAIQKLRTDPTLAPETQGAVDKLVDLHSDVGNSASASASIKTLRQKASNLIKNDNPDLQDRGHVMKGISRALEDVLERRAVAAGQPELATQFQQARKSYAQISAVDDASKGGMIDPQQLLKARNKGAPLTDDLADIANAAEQLPDVVKHQHAFSGGASSLPTTAVGAIQGMLRNLGGRAVLNGPYQKSLRGTPRDLSDALTAPEAPTPSSGPQPPPWMTASPPSAPPAAPAGQPGQIPLADLLSYGVEQPPSQGLSSAPMGSPAQSGIPFVRNAEHEAGDLSLADAWASPTDMSLSPAERAAGRERTAAQRTGGDAQSEPELIPRGAAEREGEVARRNSQEVRTYGGQPANQDLAEVMSSNVPDNIMAKSPPASAPDFENLGQPLVSHEARPDGTHVFSSPNGTTTAVRLPDGSLKITGSTTSKAARGTGEGTARIEAAADFAHKSGDPVVSDNEVSGPEQKVYDSLKRKGLDVRVNPHATDRGTGVKKSASELKGVYEIHPPLGFSLQ